MKPLVLLRHLTALYVEDDPEQRETMGDLLRGFFHELVTAADGAEGLQLFQVQPVHFVIADLKMPVMNGLELASAIRRLALGQQAGLAEIAPSEGPGAAGEGERVALGPGFGGGDNGPAAGRVEQAAAREDRGVAVPAQDDARAGTVGANRESPVSE